MAKSTAKPKQSKPKPSDPQRRYADPKYIQLQPGQLTDGDKDKYDAYASILQTIPKPRAGASLLMKLSDVLGQQAVDKIQQLGQMVFHSVGDTGADKQYRVKDEENVVSMMIGDFTAADKEKPSFFYHLGDVVYEFGQAPSYYSQFYEPYCRYNAPIFAIPGNHDGMVWDKSIKSLDAFLKNFCTAQPGPAPNAAGLQRTTMNQPGVYFTLECPFVSIIGLYSNVVDKGAGVMSSENGKYSVITDDQKKFLIAELKRLAPTRNANKTAVIVAIHHPPFNGNPNDKNAMSDDLDDAFTKGGLWPDVVLSGHAHLYQRFERNVNGRTLPYLVAGCGGYNLSPYETASNPAQKVPTAMVASHLGLKCYVKSFGCMRVKVSATKLAVSFDCADNQYGKAYDSIIIDLKTHGVTEGVKGTEPSVS